MYSIKKYKTFYPYSDKYKLIEVSVTINNNDLKNLSKDDIFLKYSLDNKDEEILESQNIT